MPTTRSQAAAGPSRTGRKRKAAAAADTTPKQKKPKTGERSADETYLQQAIAEFAAQKGYPKKSQRPQVLETAQRYFRRFQPPRADDMRVLDASSGEAQRLLASDEPIARPVFVRDGANWSMLDRTSPRRPIEQMFDFLPDLDTEEEFNDESLPQARRLAYMSVREIRQRFLRPAGKVPPKYPKNFLDLVSPMLDHGIPRFMQSGQCALLQDIMRRALDREVADVCTCDAGNGPGMPRCEHGISVAELAELQQAWRHWPGTVMLAESGCISYPHWDKYSTGTWISCLEGEIGFGWLARPVSRKQAVGWLEDVEMPRGRWCFKVLRAGETVYMPPGTVHFVFRKPKGGQTLGFAGQMLRRADVVEWLRYLRIELEFAAGDEIEDAPYLQIIPGMMDELLQLVNGACKEGEFEKFGGKEVIAKMLKEMEAIGKVIDDVRETADKLSKVDESSE